MRMSDVDVAGLGILLFLYAIFFALSIIGLVFAYIATTHSIKRRIADGEEFGTGSVFAWFLGWSAASAYSLGIATIIYFIVKRADINATKLQCSQALRNVRMARTNQYAYQQQYQQHNVQPGQQPPSQQPPQQPY